MAKKYPPYQTCHRRFQQCVRSGKLEKVLRKLAEQLQTEGRLNLEEAFIDATFVAAQKGASELVLPSEAKGQRSRLSPVGDSVPAGASVRAASPHESRFVEEAFGHSFLDELPARLIGDKAYDSDGLDRRMREQYGIEVIAPHRSDRKEPTQDGRPLRRHRRRWTIERLFAWLQIYRRLATRWKYHIENFFGMVRLGCMNIMLRYL